MQIRALVRIPTGLPRNCRSNPMMIPDRKQHSNASHVNGLMSITLMAVLSAASPRDPRSRTHVDHTIPWRQHIR